jgi:hypothetical protein
LPCFVLVTVAEFCECDYDFKGVVLCGVRIVFDDFFDVSYCQLKQTVDMEHDFEEILHLLQGKNVGKDSFGCSRYAFDVRTLDLLRQTHGHNFQFQQSHVSVGLTHHFLLFEVLLYSLLCFREFNSGDSVIEEE